MLYVHVAIHWSKALALSIVCWPSKFFFIKGPVSKLHTKISAFYEHLPWKVQDFSKELSSPCSVLGKMPVRIKSLRGFCRALYFQRKMFNKLAPDRIWLYVPVFERFLHHKISVGISCVHYFFQGWVHWCCHLERAKFGIRKWDFSWVFAFPSTLHAWLKYIKTKYFPSAQPCKNTIISKYAARQTQYFGEILHFPRQMCGKRWDLYMQFFHWPFNKYDF